MKVEETTTSSSSSGAHNRNEGTPTKDVTPTKVPGAAGVTHAPDLDTLFGESKLLTDADKTYIQNYFAPNWQEYFSPSMAPVKIRLSETDRVDSIGGLCCSRYLIAMCFVIFRLMRPESRLRRA
jgi:hypothetical protein